MTTNLPLLEHTKEETLLGEMRALSRLAAPIALAHLSLMAMGLVDTAILGRLSVDDLAGTALGRSIVLAASSLGMGVGYALEPLAAQALGAGERDRAWASLRAVLVAGAAVTLPSLLLSLLATRLVAPLGVDPALLRVAQDFILGQAPGLFAFVAYLAGREFLQAHGSTWPALYAALVANVVNGVACGLLVHGDDALAWAGLGPVGLPRYGAFGAGLATSLANVVLAAIVLASARRYRARGAAAVAPSVALRLGVPIGLQLLAEISVFSVVALLAGRMGAVAAAANQVGFALVNFTFMGAYGIGGATAIRVGYAVGRAEPPRRAGVAGILLGVAVMSLSAVTFAAAPRALMGLFTHDEAVIATGVPLLRIAAAFQLFDGVQGVASGALRGAGDVRFPFYANVGAHWLLGLPTALVLGFGLGLGPRGLWLGLTAGLVAIAVLLTRRFLHLSGARVERV